MKTNLKALVHITVVSSLIALITGQSNGSLGSSKRSRQNNEPAEQGRTLGLIRPLLGLGLGTIAAYDSPYKPASTSESVQSDPYYGNYGYGNYGGYNPNYYNGYNYYGGHPLYRLIFPSHLFPFYGGYRPQVYPGNYGGYPQTNIYGGQLPVYNNPIPRPIAQRPAAAGQPTVYPSSATTSQTAGVTANPAANSAQAAQIANLLGQLLGQQLRPLLNQGSTTLQARDYIG